MDEFRDEDVVGQCFLLKLPARKLNMPSEDGDRHEIPFGLKVKKDRRR
ncbi:hypothetical protein [Devosia sp. Leaf64]|nr:hypothetical protein [Devosia sp. Leaf64]